MTNDIQFDYIHSPPLSEMIMLKKRVVHNLNILKSIWQIVFTQLVNIIVAGVGLGGKPRMAVDQAILYDVWPTSRPRLE